MEWDFFPGKNWFFRVLPMRREWTKLVRFSDSQKDNTNSMKHQLLALPDVPVVTSISQDCLPHLHRRPTDDPLCSSLPGTGRPLKPHPGPSHCSSKHCFAATRPRPTRDGLTSYTISIRVSAATRFQNQDNHYEHKARPPEVNFGAFLWKIGSGYPSMCLFSCHLTAL